MCLHYWRLAFPLYCSFSFFIVFQPLNEFNRRFLRVILVLDPYHFRSLGFFKFLVIFSIVLFSNNCFFTFIVQGYLLHLRSTQPGFAYLVQNWHHNLQWKVISARASLWVCKTDIKPEVFILLILRLASGTAIEIVELWIIFDQTFINWSSCWK